MVRKKKAAKRTVKAKHAKKKKPAAKKGRPVPAAAGHAAAGGAAGKTKPGATRPAARPAALEGPLSVRSLAEVAEFFGAAISTVKGWGQDRRDPMPGRPGNYDVREIVRWRFAETRTRERTGDGETLARLTAAKLAGDIKKQQIQIAKLEETLIDVGVVERMISRVIVEHNALADELAERGGQLIPPAGTRIKKGDKKRIRAAWESLVRGLREAMSIGLDEWAEQMRGDAGRQDQDD